MLNPTAVMQAAYSPGSSNREALALTMQSPSPITSSPLTRLQGMQPFDYRKEPISPISSPVNSDKSLPPSVLSSKSPENLSLTTSNSTSPRASVSTGMSLNTTPLSTPKQEAPEDLRALQCQMMTVQTVSSTTARRPLILTHQKWFIILEFCLQVQFTQTRK